MIEYLPSLLATLGVLATVFFQYRAAQIKTLSETKTNAEIQLRDDMMQMIKESDGKIEKLETKQDTLQAKIDVLQEENRGLKMENGKLQRENTKLSARLADVETELARIEEKVVLRPDLRKPKE